MSVKVSYEDGCIIIRLDAAEVVQAHCAALENFEDEEDVLWDFVLLGKRPRRPEPYD